MHPNPAREATRLRDLSPHQWKSGAAAWLGWMFDGLELHLYTLVATPLVVQLLAVSSAGRSSFLPDVPTLKESGYDVVVDVWLGVLVPAKTSDDTVKALNAAIRDTFAAPDVTEKLAALGNEPFYQTPAEFAATISADLKRWEPVIKASGFVAD